MSERAAQLYLSALFLVGAIVFVLLDHDQISVALVGALLGQGASSGVRTAVNGNNK